MAKVCAKCGAQVNDKAKFCIKCGTAVETPPPARQAPPPPNKGRSKNVLFVIIIVAVAVATVLMLGNLQGGREEPAAEEPPPAIAYEEPEEDAEVLEPPPVIEPEPELEDEFEYIEGMTEEDPTLFDFAVLPERGFPRGSWSVNQIIDAYGPPEDITADYLEGYELVFVRVYYADVYISFFPKDLESFSFSGEVYDSGMSTLNENDKDIELEISSISIFDEDIMLPNDIRIGQSTKEQVVMAYREFPAYIFQSDEYDTNMIIYNYAFLDEEGEMDLEDAGLTGGISYIFDAGDVLRNVTIEWTFFDL